MGRMVRKQVYIEPEQEEFLKRRAEEAGVTESDLIRQAIDHVMREPTRFPRGRKAWQEALAFMRKRAELPHQDPPPATRGWTREELYEERLNQISRRH